MDKYYIDYCEKGLIKKLLLYRKIVKVEKDSLYLDNGTELEILPNTGCICGAGCYEITELNNCDNVITDVEVLEEEINSEYGDYSYKIFVYAEDKRLKILQVDGSDGNGYYGTGYSIIVKERGTDNA